MRCQLKACKVPDRMRSTMCGWSRRTLGAERRQLGKVGRGGGQLVSHSGGIPDVAPPVGSG